MTQIRLIYQLLLFGLTLASSLTSFGQRQISVQQLELSQLPERIKLEGNVYNAVRYSDNLGDNIVITTQTGVYHSKKFKHENEGADAELFAYHFLIKNDSAVQTWKVYDYISDCPVDLEATFIKNTFQVTDLNNDGVAEVWLMYKTVCHGDVSPCDMKIIMYQGKQKFAMRGQNKVFMGTDSNGVDQFIGGDYKYDVAFANGPKAFLVFARKLWENNIMQKWGEG